jgi:hypothetical protein
MFIGKNANQKMVSWAWKLQQPNDFQHALELEHLKQKHP